MVKVAELLLEREVLDGAEIRTIVGGGDLPPMGGSRDTADHDTQQVLRPDTSGGRRLPGLNEGEQPA
jgi:hypothetical protein